MWVYLLNFSLGKWSSLLYASKWKTVLYNVTVLWKKRFSLLCEFTYWTFHWASGLAYCVPSNERPCTETVLTIKKQSSLPCEFTHWRDLCENFSLSKRSSLPCQRRRLNVVVPVRRRRRFSSIRRIRRTKVFRRPSGWTATGNNFIKLFTDVIYKCSQ